MMGLHPTYVKDNFLEDNNGRTSKQNSMQCNWYRYWDKTCFSLKSTLENNSIGKTLQTTYRDSL
jgi:hypothetical protein